MNQKHVKIGETYHVKNIAGNQVKVTVKARKVAPKSGVVSFQVLEDGDTETVDVGAKVLSPLPAAS